MDAQDNETEQRVVVAFIVGVVLLVVGGVLGLGVMSVRGEKTASAPAVASAPATPAPPVSASDASVVVENGVVKFYFATGKAELAPGALAALTDAIAAARGGARLVLSGFHDATGDPASNAELARQRALAVRDALLGAGVAEASLELKKPEVSTGSGANAEARRVEVVIAR
jgi:outer membrane protein OmpA-like peptidoglycan-associated protein